MAKSIINEAVNAAVENALTPKASKTTERLLINAKEVCERLGGISRSLLSKWTNNPEMNFPQRAAFGGARANFWVAAEIDAWALKYHQEHAGQYRKTLTA